MLVTTPSGTTCAWRSTGPRTPSPSGSTRAPRCAPSRRLPINVDPYTGFVDRFRDAFRHETDGLRPLAGREIGTPALRTPRGRACGVGDRLRGVGRRRRPVRWPTSPTGAEHGMAETRPTIHDVAARAGVSKSLVSLALRGSPGVSEASREAILAAAANSATVRTRPHAASPNTEPDNRRCSCSICTTRSSPRSSTASQSEVRGGATHRCSSPVARPRDRAGRSSTSCSVPGRGPHPVIHRLPAGPCRPSRWSTPHRHHPTPTVTRPGIDTVCNDDVAGAASGVGYLVDLGRRRIVDLPAATTPPRRTGRGAA